MASFSFRVPLLIPAATASSMLTLLCIARSISSVYSIAELRLVFNEYIIAKTPLIKTDSIQTIINTRRRTTANIRPILALSPSFAASLLTFFPFRFISTFLHTHTDINICFSLNFKINNQITICIIIILFVSIFNLLS